MTKKSGVRKSQKQDLAKVIEQMDCWIQPQTNLCLSISTSLFSLFLRGRMVARRKRLFLFIAHDEVCRVPVIPEVYDRVMCHQKGGPVSVTLKNTSGMEGKLTFIEDVRETEERGEEEGLQDCQRREESVPGARGVICEQE